MDRHGKRTPDDTITKPMLIRKNEPWCGIARAEIIQLQDNTENCVIRAEQIVALQSVKTKNPIVEVSHQQIKFRLTQY